MEALNPAFFITLIVFVLGAVFWAGSTYNRIVGIEKQLRNIGDHLGRIAELPMLIERSIDNQRRIEKLENIILRSE